MSLGGSNTQVSTGRVPIRGAGFMVEVVGALGPAFVWSHGILSCRAQEDRDGLFDWRLVTDQRWRWVRYDARGHGESDGTTNVAAYSWREAGRDLLTLADTLGITRFAGGGACTGCAALLEAALAAPERIDRLVLVTPPAAWDHHSEQADRYQQQAAYLRSQGTEWTAGLAGTARPPILANEPALPPFVPCVDPEWLPAVLRGAAASNLPLPQDLAELVQPALILAWEDDPARPLSTAQQLAEILPRADLYIARTFRQVQDWPRLVATFLGPGVA